jgi:hypothetical protein
MGGTGISRIGRIRIGVGVRGRGGVRGKIERDIKVGGDSPGQSPLTVSVVADHDSSLSFRFAVLECLCPPSNQTCFAYRDEGTSLS